MTQLEVLQVLKYDNNRLKRYLQMPYLLVSHYAVDTVQFIITCNCLTIQCFLLPFSTALPYPTNWVRMGRNVEGRPKRMLEASIESSAVHTRFMPLLDQASLFDQEFFDYVDVWMYFATESQTQETLHEVIYPCLSQGIIHILSPQNFTLCNTQNHAISSNCLPLHSTQPVDVIYVCSLGVHMSLMFLLTQVALHFYCIAG